MIPQHFSRDVVERCRRLIHALIDEVDRGEGELREPLRTTFLLAMATPMIVLPVERLMRPLRGQAAGLAQDLPGGYDDAVASVLGPGKAFANTPFFRAGAWSRIPRHGRFNLAESWPAPALDRLGALESFQHAARVDAWTLLRDLRNALAHGNIAYLDGHGRSSDGEAEMLGLASFAHAPGNEHTPINLLRVHQNDFLDFLDAWADWIQNPHVRRALRLAA